MLHGTHAYHKLKPLHSEGFSGNGKPLFSFATEKARANFKAEIGKVWSSVADRTGSIFRQIFATILIFGVFFIILNWNAISQNIVWEYQKFTQHTDTNNPLYGLLEKKTVSQDPLPLVKNAQEAERQIPLLSMTIAPPDTRLVIPRINRNVPVINVSTESIIKKDWAKLEKDMQEALRYGVIHYPGTARPGQQGNIVITGHSSYFLWDPGRFKDVFAVLHDVRLGDQILLYNDQKRYIYQVTNIKKIWPSELDVLQPSTENKLTLITCTPVGTNAKRLIVEAKLIKVES